MNGYEVMQRLNLTSESTKPSITARIKIKERKNQPHWWSPCELTLNNHLCGQRQTAALFHLASVWMGSLSLAWFDNISYIFPNMTSKWEFENTMQI